MTALDGQGVSGADGCANPHCEGGTIRGTQGVTCAICEGEPQCRFTVEYDLDGAPLVVRCHLRAGHAGGHNVSHPAFDGVVCL
jgi:hypothetical protein